MMPKDLYLVRHGMSLGNEKRKQFEDTNDASVYTPEFLRMHESQYPLIPRGIEQAKQAGAWFHEQGITKFFRMLVSNNVRAMETAAYLGFDDAQWMIDFNLRERDGGLFNAITPDQRDTDYQHEQKYWKSQPFMNRPPQGESLADLALRVKIILDTLARECDGKRVVAVCHGHTIRIFQMILRRLGPQESHKLLSLGDDEYRVPNGSITHFTRQDPDDPTAELSDAFGWWRMIRPAGGGAAEDPFQKIVRKRFTNQELLDEAAKILAF